MDEPRPERHADGEIRETSGEACAGQEAAGVRATWWPSVGFWTDAVAAPGAGALARMEDGGLLRRGGRGVAGEAEAECQGGVASDSLTVAGLGERDAARMPRMEGGKAVRGRSPSLFLAPSTVDDQ